jgi:hypothetical protein
MIIKKAEKALKAAAQQAAKDHRRSGLPLVVWKNGRVVRIPANKI